MTNATWNIELRTRCPHCDMSVDVFDTPDLMESVRVGESKPDIEVDCPECGRSFKVETVY